MCLAGCPSASCAALVLLAAVSFVPLIRLAPRPVVRVVPLFSYPPAHLVLRALSCLSGWHVRLVSYAHPACSRLARSPRRSAYPPRLSCRRAGRPCVSLSSRHAFRLPSCVFCLPPCVPLIIGVRLLMSSPRSCVPLLPCRLLLFSPYRPAYSCREAGRCLTIGLALMIFLVGFLRGRVIFPACVCYNVCRGDGDLRMGGIRASVSYATPPYAGGVVCFLLLSTRRPHSCSILVVPLFLIAPPFYTIGGAISFSLLIIMSSLPTYPRRMSLSSARVDAVRFFGGFIWILDRLLARPAVSHPSHPYSARCP